MLIYFPGIYSFDSSTFVIICFDFLAFYKPIIHIFSRNFNFTYCFTMIPDIGSGTKSIIILANRYVKL